MGLIDNLKNISTVKEGDLLKSQSARLKENNPEQGTISLTGLPGKNIIIGVPGAFTPPCACPL